jgi:TonB family protein
MKNHTHNVLRFAQVAAIVVVSFRAMAPAAVADEIYKVGGDVTAPKLIHKEEPKYTKRAKKAKLKGTVSLIAVINSDGIPENIQVVKSLHPDLDAEAVKAVSNWRFKPAEKSGQPVAVHVNIEVNFRLCCSF